MTRCFLFIRILLTVCLTATGVLAASAQGNRLTHLDESDPFHVGTGFPKLTTPQWVGESGVEAVGILAIDDLGGAPKKYEDYLRPILRRLQAIDGRGPVSIYCNSLDVEEPQLQAWLRFQVGSELGSLADTSVDALMVAILDPNRAVEAGFLNYTATLRSGREFSGVIVAETANSVRMRTAGGAEETFLRNDLEFYRSLRQSHGLDHEEAVRESVVGILMSPSFCFRMDLAGEPFD